MNTSIFTNNSRINNSITNNITNITRIVTRTAKTLAAFALLSLASAAVKADVIVDTNTDGSIKFAGPRALTTILPTSASPPA